MCTTRPIGPGGSGRRRARRPAPTSLATLLRRGAVAVHVLFAAAGFHALFYGAFLTARVNIDLRRLESTLALFGAATLFAAATAAALMLLLWPRAASGLDALLPCSALRHRARWLRPRGVPHMSRKEGAALEVVGAQGESGARAEAVLAGGARRRHDGAISKGSDASAVGFRGQHGSEDVDDGEADEDEAGDDVADLVDAELVRRAMAGWSCAVAPLARCAVRLQRDPETADSLFVGFLVLLWAEGTAAPTTTVIFERRWTSPAQVFAYLGIVSATALLLAAVCVTAASRSGILAAGMSGAGAGIGRGVLNRVSTLRASLVPLVASGLSCAFFLWLHVDRGGGLHISPWGDE